MFRKISNDAYTIELAKFGGLLLYVLITTFTWLLHPTDETPVREILSSSLSRFMGGYLAITLLFYFLGRQTRKSILPPRLFGVLLIPGCYLISLLWITVMANLNNLFCSEPLIFSNFFFYKAFSLLPIAIALLGLFYLINHAINLKKQRLLTLEANNLANEAQLQMLRYQINPHFLFNSLNTIRSMVEEDKSIARRMITELSNFFRYSLSQNGTSDTLENEISAIKNYLAIQKIRFEERLLVEYDIDQKLCQVRIPFFIILPLVENAIKFGLQTSQSPLKIIISASADENLTIRVQNTGHLVSESTNNEGTSTGIVNTRKRLEIYFKEHFSFDLFEEDSWVIAQIIIQDYKNKLAE